MADSLAGLVLAAGAGSRLWPLTSELPKALCPLGDRALVDHAIERLLPVVGEVAVNVHHGAVALHAHVDELTPTAHVSIEDPVALGTAGALGNLAGWLDRRAVLVVNADTYTTADLGGFVEEWDRSRVCILTGTPGDFGPRSTVVASIVPGDVAARLPFEPIGMWEALWRDELAAGRLQAVHTDALTLDCGTPARYLEANLRWLRVRDHLDRSGNAWVSRDAVVTGELRDSIVGSGARVDGTTRDCVIWPGAVVEPAERLSNAIRTPARTVMVRSQDRLRGTRTGVAT